MRYLSLNYWIENYLVSFLKKYLDKSGEGWKTVLGLLILIVSELLKLCTGTACTVITQVNAILLQLPYAKITDAGITLLVAGLAHKFINYIPRKK